MRRRHQLRPDTFPFLAVLLCAMGSLILVLMELDRRARSEAHHRAEQSWLQTQREKAELLAHLRAEREAMREAELNRQKQARDARRATHRAEQQDLRRQAQSVLADHARVQDELEALLRTLQSDQGARTDSEKKLAQQTKQTELALEALAAREKQVEKDEQHVKEKRSSGDRLTRDLLLLEEALARLKVQRQRQGKTWSIVPYVGKRGMNRKPMYVECDAEGLLFHPDRKRIGREASVLALGEEIDRRMKEFAAKQPAGERAAEPYWMLLVRPQGITAYYEFLHTIKPLDVAYGYEFIDASWDLDFPDPTTLPAPVEVAVPLPGPVRREIPGLPPPAAATSGSNNVPGTDTARIGIGPLVPRPYPSIPGLASNGPPSAEIGVPARFGPFQLGGNGGSGQVGAASATPRGVLHAQIGDGPGGTATGPGVPGSGKGGSPSPGPGTPSAGPPGSGSPLAATGAPSAVGTPTSTQSEPPLAPPSPLPSSPLRGSGTGGEGADPRVQGAPTPQPLFPADGTAGQSARPPTLGSGLPAASTGAPSASGTATGPQGVPPASPPNPLYPSGSTGGPQGSEGGGEPGPLTPPGPPLQGGTGSRGSGKGGMGGGSGSEGAPRPAYRYSTPEWIILVECRPEGIVVSPSRQSFPLASLTAGQGQFAAQVRELIAHRRAAQRPGEDPVKIVVRFQVQKEGLRTFHLAYPLLDGIDVEKRAVLSGE
jgi:hypothetical protein